MKRMNQNLPKFTTYLIEQKLTCQILSKRFSRLATSTSYCEFEAVINKNVLPTYRSRLVHLAVEKRLSLPIKF